MVCGKCEKKLSKVIVPDKWKDGASNTTEGGGRKINENKLLSKKNRLESPTHCSCGYLLSISGNRDASFSELYRLVQTVEAKETLMCLHLT
ncbi:PREDICTED: cysteine-rich PDZ-binding protein isoform X2 [Tarenaya hassleriana]|uniref:cysteine-rich PDZ-binding protein isoform X2 n=1 Tax=Tarenaya hassleriana TaxID=28532 RepID=UPI00053CA1F1|nr:PREDICTED: cysteine-rich PDZ-binding protein isoform X2 [Tarenaya hassleriana]